jgi:hypothetical protein
MSIHLSTKLRDTGDGALMHWCPGCKSRHLIETKERNPNGAIWAWDGNAEAPTFSPSINIVGRCHYFIVSGQIQFCGDSAHSLAGQTVPLPDFPEWTK